MDVYTISPELLAETFPEGIDLIFASPPTVAKHLPTTHKNHGPHDPIIVHRIVHLIMYLTWSQPGKVGDV